MKKVLLIAPWKDACVGGVARHGVSDKPAVFNHIISTLYIEQKDKLGNPIRSVLDIRASSGLISSPQKKEVEQQRVVLGEWRSVCAWTSYQCPTEACCAVREG
jgi:hypothetical protein